MIAMPRREAGRLGLSREALDRLAALEAIGTVPKPRRAQGDA